MASCIHRASVVGRALRVTAILSVALSVAMSTAQAAELHVPVSSAQANPFWVERNMPSGWLTEHLSIIRDRCG